MSYKDAVNSVVCEHVAAGATVFNGQFGQIIAQYPDRHVAIRGLVSVTNSGEYTPRPTFSGEAPDRDGQGLGEQVYSRSGHHSWVWYEQGWVKAY
jgi:hypothetical protein